MPSLNQVNLIGNLTRDPELRYTPKGSAVAKCGLAINRTWKNEAGEKKEEATFIDFEAWGHTAEALAKFCKKGKSIYVGGRLQLDVWEDKNTHQKQQKLKVVAEQIQFLGGRDDNTGAGPAPKTEAPEAKAEKEDDSQIPF